jgi:hypothetical protein
MYRRRLPRDCTLSTNLQWTVSAWHSLRRNPVLCPFSSSSSLEVMPVRVLLQPSSQYSRWLTSVQGSSTSGSEMSMRHLDVSQHDSTAPATAHSSLEATYASASSAATAAAAAASEQPRVPPRRQPAPVRVPGSHPRPTSVDAITGKPKGSKIPKASKIPSPEKDGVAGKGRSKRLPGSKEYGSAGVGPGSSGKSASNVSQFVHPLLRNNKAALEHVQRIKTGSESGRGRHDSGKQPTSFPLSNEGMRRQLTCELCIGLV